MPPSSAASAVTEEKSIPTGRFQPLTSLKRRKWLAVLVMVLVWGLGLVAALNAPKAYYEANGVVLIAPKSATNLERSQQLLGQDYSRYISQQRHLLKRHDVLQEVLQDEQVKDFWLRTNEETGEKEKEEKAIKRLYKALDLSSKPTSHPFITVSLEKDSPNGADYIVNTLLDVYLRKSQEENIYDSDGRIAELQRVHNEFQTLIEQRRQRRLQIAQELGVTTFQEDNLNPYDSILIDMETAYKQARRDRVQAEAQLAALQQGRQGALTLDAVVREKVANDSNLIGLNSYLLKQRSDLTTQMIGLTPENPSYQRLQREVAKLDQELSSAESGIYRDIKERILAQHRAAIYQTSQVENSLAEEINQQRREATRYASLYNEALDLNKDIERAFRQVDRINSRIEELSIESSAPGFARIYAYAREPEEPQGGGRKKIFLAFIVLGVLAGLSLPVLIDMLDRRLHTIGEVNKQLGFPPIAWILERESREHESLIFDQLRRLAMALYRDKQTHNTYCFALTSVKPDGGTTTLTLELARRLSELGIRALALELNAFNPDARYHDPLSRSQEGLANILAREDWSPQQVERLIIPESSEMPARLSVGKTAERHLMTYGRLPALLEHLSSLYDLILLDTPPILVSADAELLGDIGAGILLVIEAGHVYPGELKRAVGLLERLDPPVVAAVLNRVAVFHGGGYFSGLMQEYETGTKQKPSWVKRLLWSS